MIRRTLAGVAATLVAGSLALAAPATAAPAAAQKAALGDKSLAAVLTSKANNGGNFDRNWHNYSIVTQAVLAVLKAKPDSAVSALTKGSVPVTAFIPNDRAFQRLVKTLTGKTLMSEKAVFNAVAGLGIPTVEAVLLYHVVPGATIMSSDVVMLKKPTALKTAQGQTITVKIVNLKKLDISIVDKFPMGRNARLIASQLDINKGNKQIAHGIDRVLLPLAKV